jgi:DNA polymerase III delta subunit
VIYFYFGDNEFEVRRQVETLTKQFAAENSVAAVSQLDTADSEAQTLLAEIVNLNLFMPRRLLVLAGLDDNRAAWQLLGDNLGRLPEVTTLVITAKKPDKRSRTFKQLLKNAQWQEFSSLNSQATKHWIVDEAKRLGVTIADLAVAELVERCGANQSTIAQELQKLSLLGQSIDQAIIQQYVEPNLTADAFSVLEKAIRGQTNQMTLALERLRQTEDANRFLGLISSQLWSLSAAVLVGSGADVAKRLAIHPFQLSKMQQLAVDLGASKTVRQRRLAEIIKIFAETDAKIKLASHKNAWTLITVGLGRL